MPKKGNCMKKRRYKSIPIFKSESQERSFWQTHDSSLYVDYSKAEHWQFPNLKLTSKPITLRLPVALVDRVKLYAHRMDVPYQTIMKRFIAEAVSAL